MLFFWRSVFLRVKKDELHLWKKALCFGDQLFFCEKTPLFLLKAVTEKLV